MSSADISEGLAEEGGAEGACREGARATPFAELPEEEATLYIYRHPQFEPIRFIVINVCIVDSVY